jgi:hypothetical protein
MAHKLNLFPTLKPWHGLGMREDAPAPELPPKEPLKQYRVSFTVTVEDSADWIQGHVLDNLLEDGECLDNFRCELVES